MLASIPPSAATHASPFTPLENVQIQLGEGAQLAQGRCERCVHDNPLHDQGAPLAAVFEHRRRERIHAHAGRGEPSRAIREKEGHALAGEGDAHDEEAGVDQKV